MRSKRFLILMAALAAATIMTGCDDMDQSRNDSAEKAARADGGQSMPPLTEAEARVLRDKGTERPFTGKYWDFFGEGVYLCRQCGSPLYRSASKFRSECGWPSFDDEIDGAVTRQLDADGRRTEIICARCGGHLGHVFLGEGYTDKDTRHCVNSISLVFKSVEQLKREQAEAAEAAEAAENGPTTKPAVETAIFAGGCFWGVEHHFDGAEGVISAESGYTGGHLANPTYEQVCTGRTGHAEAVRVVYDPARTSYEKLARLFFETHDPTTLNRQGPDRGTQYRSAIYYHTAEQKAAAEASKKKLNDSGRFRNPVVTEITPAATFWRAEESHQRYLEKRGIDNCHLP